jgi:hypothetical protein
MYTYFSNIARARKTTSQKYQHSLNKIKLLRPSADPASYNPIIYKEIIKTLIFLFFYKIFFRYNNQTSVKQNFNFTENRAFQSATQHKPSRY